VIAGLIIVTAKQNLDGGGSWAKRGHFRLRRAGCGAQLTKHRDPTVYIYIYIYIYTIASHEVLTK